MLRRTFQGKRHLPDAELPEAVGDGEGMPVRKERDGPAASRHSGGPSGIRWPSPTPAVDRPAGWDGSAAEGQTKRGMVRFLLGIAKAGTTPLY